MKRKTLIVAALTVFAGAFVACDGEDVNSLISQVVGHADMVVTGTEESVLGQTETHYAVGDTIHFGSVLADGISGTVTVEGLEVGVDGFVAVGSGSTVSTSSASLSFPLFGIKLQGAEARSYSLDSPFTGSEFIRTIASSWQRLLTGNDLNAFFITEVDRADTVLYMAVGGNVALGEVPDYGGTISGTFDNVRMKVMRYSTIMRVKDMIDNPDSEDAIQWATLIASNQYEEFFPTITLNGSFQCLRANIIGLVQRMQN